MISGKHTNFSEIKKNGCNLKIPEQGLTNSSSISESEYQLRIDEIYEFSNVVDLEENPEFVNILNQQIDFNVNIASTGVTGNWGNQIGKTLLALDKNDLAFKVSAWATAGTDARMGGCSLPVVINSGSGNQGITVSIPVIIAARELGYSHEKLLRSLIFANLVSIHTKAHIGYLSAFCGAVTAAAGAGAGIAYLYDMSLAQINMVITNTLVASIGILCDGAKPSCSLKVYSSLSSAMLAVEMAKNQNVIDPGDGFVGDTIEETIENIGRIAREGMNQADIEILNVIVNNNKPKDC